MAPWGWFVLIVAVGVCLLAAALLLDRTARRRVTGAGEPAPKRDHPVVDSHVPAYVTQDEIDELPAPNAGHPGTVSHRGEGFGFGHASADFATIRDGAAWTDPVLLIVDGAVDSMRELMAPLSWATDERPLVVVAGAIAPEVVATLGANRRALGSPVVAAVADQRDRRRLAELTGATQLAPSDLQAGYVPDSALGHAAHWSSTRTRTWVEPEGEPQPGT